MRRPRGLARGANVRSDLVAEEIGCARRGSRLGLQPFDFAGLGDQNVLNLLSERVRLRHAAAQLRRLRFAWNVKARQRFDRSEEHTSELQSRENLVCRLLLEKK